jgi:hypothetical protein
MDHERAETYLRLLAEAELRRAMTTPASGNHGQWKSARLTQVARALTAVGAVSADVADEIQADAGLAVAGRRPVYPHGTRWLPTERHGRIRPPPQPASYRLVPVNQLITIQDDGVRRDLLLVAYVQSGNGGRFMAAGLRFRPSGAADDRGVSYQFGFRGSPAAGELVLHPDPPHQIRWLDLVPAAGEPATRIDLDRHIPVPEVTVTRNIHSPGELLLDVIAARILAGADVSPGQPGHLTAAGAEGAGHVVAALHATGLLPPDSPVPGQLAGLCGRLGIDGHGITAPPAGDLPERWRSMLIPPSRGEPPVPGILAATPAGLPELDGARIAIAGLHHGQRGTIMHLLVSGVTLEGGWEYARGVRPLPVLWIRDSNDRWHTTRVAGVSLWGNPGEVALWLWLVPPLERGTAWIELSATGRSAEARVTLPLSSRYPEAHFDDGARSPWLAVTFPERRRVASGLCRGLRGAPAGRRGPGLRP